MLRLKFKAFFGRIVRIFTLFPLRFLRLLRHFWRGVTFQITSKEYWKDETVEKNGVYVSVIWLTEIGVLFLELLGVGELYESLNDFVKFNNRPLTSKEIELAKSIYQNSIDYQAVRIDERAWAGPKQYHFCYVSFNLINSWGPMRPPIFIHEMMHIWQYQQMGAIYMIRALLAQHSQMGYNYGGVATIRHKMATGQTLFDFNLEQQAEVVTDYFLLKSGQRPQWGMAMVKDISDYENILTALMKKFN
ncbi:MAG: hypothetical protein AAF960_06690 [Bacteroidota bacterium]